ncbi:hypothetical protein OKW41_004303 [Paraburkholderia sp. UCT70]|uniref:reverse transcriptase domain-containing protein n=1 Tax=Paraburkholderia sp. UCT70 TaxID=2991068 RepID=UPI003D1BB397
MKIEASPVSETTKQDADAPGSCVQRKFASASIWTDAMLAALQNGVKGGKWHSLIDKVFRLETLALGWAQVEKNAGAAGVDRMSVKRFAQARDRYLAELAQALQDGSYRPQPVRRVYIPKGKGRRPLGIPAVKDRVVQAALKLVIEPIFEHEFEPRSYGFRPGLGCKDALREVDRHVKAGYCWVVDADLQSYFDSIPHSPLHIPRKSSGHSAAKRASIPRETEQAFHNKASAADMATRGEFFYSFPPSAVKLFRRLRIDSPESVKRCAL